MSLGDVLSGSFLAPIIDGVRKTDAPSNIDSVGKGGFGLLLNPPIKSPASSHVSLSLYGAREVFTLLATTNENGDRPSHRLFRQSVSNFSARPIY